jgi:hypothetical protein
MAKRKFIDVEQVITEIKNMDNNGCITRTVNHVCEDVRMIPTVSEREIIKPYLDKLKHQIHEKTFESGMMNPIMTYAEIMYMIDNLLSERGEEK